MLPDLIGVAVAALVLASPFAFRRRSRARPPAEAAAVPLAAAVIIQPSSVMTAPFAYDNGVVTAPGEDPG